MNLSRFYSKTRFYPKTLGLLTIGAALLSGCIFQGTEDVPATTDIPIKVAACRELEPGVQKTADSLVVEATAKMTGDVEYMFGDSVNSWETARTRNPQAALKLFDQALQVAPGHCGATFGRAVASAMMVTQDPKLDAFVTKAEAANNANGNQAIPKIGSGRALFKMTPDQAAPVLLKLSSELKTVDYPTITEFQSLVETTIMPKLDSTIAAMEEVLKFDGFTFVFTTKDNRTFQLDQGEIGPALAGLKVLKAYLTVAAGYQWDLAMDGKYAWFDTINNIRGPEYDNLRPGQTAALDQLTGLFKTTSPFSKVKPGWKAKVTGIPDLLLSAVNDAQKGLRFSIAKSNKPGQEHNLFVVGTGTEADVDPADLQNAVDLLERSKKYLTGEVTLSYNKGVRELKVNFTKIFDMDGVQNLMPYFQFHPYSEWNDTLTADTTWSGYMEYTAEQEIMTKLGYDGSHDYKIGIQIIGGSLPNDSLEIVDYGPFFTKDTIINGKDTLITGGDTVLATVKRSATNPCAYTYTKKFDRVPNPAGSIPNPNDPYYYANSFVSVPKVSTGSITLASCREKNGVVEFAGWVDVKTKGPIYFTTPRGEMTLDVSDVEKYSDDLPALETKVIFRDPTFGGVFPEMTQAKIWGVIKSLQTVKPRAKRICETVMSPEGNFAWSCHDVEVKDPSDLDLLISTTHLWDDML